MLEPSATWERRSQLSSDVEQSVSPWPRSTAEDAAADVLLLPAPQELAVGGIDVPRLRSMVVVRVHVRDDFDEAPVRRFTDHLIRFRARQLQAAPQVLGGGGASEQQVCPKRVNGA